MNSKGNEQIKMSEIEPELIDSKQLAKLCNVSVKFIEKHRSRIAGAVRVGATWRFSLNTVRARIAAGKNLITFKK